MAGVPLPQAPRLREVLAPQEQLGVAVELRRPRPRQAIPEEEGAVTPASRPGSLKPALGGLQHVAQVSAVESQRLVALEEAQAVVRPQAEEVGGGDRPGQLHPAKAVCRCHPLPLAEIAPAGAARCQRV